MSDELVVSGSTSGPPADVEFRAMFQGREP